MAPELAFWTFLTAAILAAAKAQLRRMPDGTELTSPLEGVSIVFYSVRQIASFSTSMGNLSVIDITLKDSTNNIIRKRRMLNVDREEIIISEADLLVPNGSVSETLDTTSLTVDPRKHHIGMRPLVASPFAVGSLAVDKNMPSNVLVVGLGGSQINNFLHHSFPKMNITVVELEPTMVDIARKHFGLLEDDHHRVIVADGIKYIKDAAQHGEKFHAVYIDACPTVYTLSDVVLCPVQGFTSNETIHQIKQILTKNGSLVIKMLLYTENVQQKAEEVAKRFMEYFPKCSLLPMLNQFNRVLICGDDTIAKQKLDAAAMTKVYKTLYSDDPLLQSSSKRF